MAWNPIVQSAVDIMLTSLAIVGVSGCVAHSAPTHIEADPLRVIADNAAYDLFEVYDANALFVRGLELMEGGVHNEALSYFIRVQEEFPESTLLVPAWFNRALCHLALEQGEEALSAIDVYLDLLPDNVAEKHIIDGRFKRGAALMQLGRHQEAAEIFDLLIVEVSRIDDQVEALVDSGIAHFMLDDRTTAEYRFLKAKRLHDQASPFEKLPLRYFVAQAHFYLAEIARLEFSDFKLRYPSADALAHAEQPELMMGKQLEQKCQLLLRAQYAFTRTIREGHTGWASAAGYKIGSMYEELYDELTQLPEPEDLTDSQRTMFRELLKEKVLILLEKAVSVWQATAEMAVRTGEENLWIEKTKASLERVRQFVLSQPPASPTGATSES